MKTLLLTARIVRSIAAVLAAVTAALAIDCRINCAEMKSYMGEPCLFSGMAGLPCDLGTFLLLCTAALGLLALLLVSWTIEEHYS